VIFAGAELFTGNVFVVTAGLTQKTIVKREALSFCVVNYLGNLAGSVLIAALFWGTGYLKDVVLATANEAIIAKTAPHFGELFVRGMLCNILVCVAAWCSYRLKSESAKLILIFWAIYLFVVCGFEHSIANMTLFSLGAIAGTGGLGVMLTNLAATTAGNIAGGALLSLAYWKIGAKTP